MFSSEDNQGDICYYLNRFWEGGTILRIPVNSFLWITSFVAMLWVPMVSRVGIQGRCSASPLLNRIQILGETTEAKKQQLSHPSSSLSPPWVGGEQAAAEPSLWSGGSLWRDVRSSLQRIGSHGTTQQTRLHLEQTLWDGAYSFHSLQPMIRVWEILDLGKYYGLNCVLSNLLCSSPSP